jgi:DNA (cytosine-5)-methyltransferase 1
MTHEILRVASFFAGIGGFDLACEREGMNVVYQCEIKPFCQQVLKKHWPQVNLQPDINNIDPETLPEADLWCAGFPCQDVSLANQGKRTGLEGERSGLFFRFAELISHRHPRWILIENVPGLLNSEEGEDFRVFLQTLDELGYGLAWRVLDAKYFGTPQRRRRIYVVGSLGSLLSAEVLFEPAATTVAFRASLGAKEISAHSIGNCSQEADIYTIQHAAIGRKHTAGPQAKGYRCDGESYTLDSRGGADAVCKTVGSFRMRDVAGVSKGLDGNRYRAVGNAVNVNVVRWIADRIVKVETRNLLKTEVNSN